MKNLSVKVIGLLATVMTFSAQLSAQESEQVETLFNSDTKLGFLGSPSIKFNSVQGDSGSLIEVNGGILLDNLMMFGLAGGMNSGIRG
ncbi:MAG: hypothetical protein MUE37_10240 [Bacteroidales bacterium]|jgi:hypothetical protein|nr:hypothetical protein [Bacteroidales bacterium]